MTTARVTQEVVEVIRQTPLSDTECRFTQLYIDVLRFGTPPVTRIHPVPPEGRVTLTGSGTRIFPVPLS